MKRPININFGILSEPIQNQLDRHKYNFDYKIIEQCNIDVTEINRLKARKIITNNDYIRFKNIIYKRILKHLKVYNSNKNL